MAKRIVTKIGNVFSMKLSDGTKGHFQFVAIDTTNLSSSVIRVFKKRYALNETPSIDEIVHGEVAFYAQAILRIGILDGVWEKIGKSDFIDSERTAKIVFGTDRIEEVSILKQVLPNLKRWRLWHVSQNSKQCDSLSDAIIDQLEIGKIFQYSSIITRLERGYYIAAHKEYNTIKRKPWPDYNSYTKRELEIGTVYFHFLGKNLMREVVVNDGKCTRFSADDKKKSWFGLKTTKAFPCNIDFADINWTYDNFITEEEFNNVWDSCTN